MPRPPEGVHPIATFLGGDRHATKDELDAAVDAGSTVLGEGMLHIVCAKLVARGIVTGELDLSSSGGWETDLRHDGARFWLNIGCTGDPKERWLASVDEHRNVLGLFSRSHPKQYAALLAVLHEVLSSIEGIHDVRWHDPDDWAHGREERWFPRPDTLEG